MDTLDLDIMARDLLMLSLRLRLMLDFSMVDMDMVLEPTDTLDLDIMVRDLLMLSLKLMLDIFMVDMDMVWDMLVLDTDMVVLDMDILIMVKLQLPLSIIFPHLQAKAQKLSVNWLLLFSTQRWVGIGKNR